ncbi:MAG: hypothetical protein WD595_00475 [Waddliaceae bacterium]
MKWNLVSFFLALLTLSSCAVSRSQEYHGFYEDLREYEPCSTFTYSPYYLVVLVDAKHLDYFNNRSFFCTLVKHPKDGSKGCDVGHCWFLLSGIENNRRVEIEGGHSGETGVNQTRYMDGVMDLMERNDPNPVRYMWTVQKDGFLQEGCGGHSPSYAVKVDLTKEKYEELYNFIYGGGYDFKNYSLTHNQCCELVRQLLAKTGREIQTKITLSIDSEVQFRHESLHLWSDPRYSRITISSPDVVEKSLHRLVKEGRAQCALRWYHMTHPDHKCKEKVCFACALSRFCRALLITRIY